MIISPHARRRMSQRAIPDQWLALLEVFGTEFAQKGATTVMDVPKAEIARVRGQLRTLLKRLDHLSNVYAVVADDGTVITAAHKTQKRECRRADAKRKPTPKWSDQDWSASA